MRGVTIGGLNKQNVLTIDLIDVLRLLENEVLETQWTLSGVEALGGEAAEELHRLSDAQARVSGRKLIELATDVSQVVDGEFRGFRNQDRNPWIIIRAIDSSAYDVFTEDEALLERLRNRFSNVNEIPA